MSQNIVIIGAGPAGESAAKTIREQTGLETNGNSVQVHLIEKEEAGGLCLNKGCIPSKTLLEHVRQWVQSGKSVDWTKLQDIKQNVVSGIRSQLQSTLKRQGINLIQGLASFTKETSLKIEGPQPQADFHFDKAIITTGTEIFYPPPLDKFKDQLLNSDKILDLKKTPDSLVIIGGGAVGIEFACLLNAAGTKVTIVEMQKGLLPGEDPLVVSTLTKSLEQRGIVVKTQARVQSLDKSGKKWNITLSTGDALEANEILACVGRIPVPSKLGLDSARIQFDRDRIKINEFLQTTNPNVYAAGDAATTRLAHAAASQARVAAKNALGAKEKYDATLVPRCLYSWPEVASVGAWKYQLDETNTPVKSTRAFFKASAKALAAGESEGFVQIVSHPETKKIFGAQIIGAHATELIHVFSVALKAKMTTKELGDVMFAHPTLSEMIKEAALK